MQILEYHVYAGHAYEASDLKKHGSLVTKEGEALEVKHLCVKKASIPALVTYGYSCTVTDCWHESLAE